jgi:hypothetical protein
MLDHFTIGVTDLTGAKVFYDAALAPLGMFEAERMHRKQQEDQQRILDSELQQAR